MQKGEIDETYLEKIYREVQLEGIYSFHSLQFIGSNIVSLGWKTLKKMKV